MARKKTRGLVDEEGGPLVDLSSFDEAQSRQDEGIEVDIKGFDGKTPIGLKIRVAGPDSKLAMKAQEEQADQLISEQVARGGELPTISSSERRARAIRFLARITMDWTPAKIELGGEKLTYSVDNAIKLYTRLPFIRDQIDRASGDRSRFMKG